MPRRVVEPLGSRRRKMAKTLWGEERETVPTVDSLVKRRAKKQRDDKRVIIRLKREL